MFIGCISQRKDSDGKGEAGEGRNFTGPCGFLFLGCHLKLTLRHGGGTPRCSPAREGTQAAAGEGASWNRAAICCGNAPLARAASWCAGHTLRGRAVHVAVCFRRRLREASPPRRTTSFAMYTGVVRPLADTELPPFMPQPMGAPEVVFVGTPPVHTHIYSNGHICLSLLADDWSPALTVSSLAVSIQSMCALATPASVTRCSVGAPCGRLSSATKKRPPKDDAVYVKRYKGASPKDTRWAFHDNKC